MPSHKMDRNCEDIKREITAVLRELKDPRVQGSLISVVRVEVTNDLSYCKVYISSMDGIENANKALEGLRSASSYIRREIASRLKLRHTPQINFLATDSIEYSANISKMLNDLKDGKND